MIHRFGSDDHYLVVNYLAEADHEYREIGPVLVNTHDYLTFYLTGASLPLHPIGYFVIHSFPNGTTEDQALDGYFGNYLQFERQGQASGRAFGLN